MSTLIDLVFDTLTNYYRTHSSEQVERIHSIALWFDLLSIHSKELIELGYDVMMVFTNLKMDEELIKLGCMETTSPIGMEWMDNVDEGGGSYFYWIDAQV